MNEFEEKQARRYVEVNRVHIVANPVNSDYNDHPVLIIKNLLDAMDTWRTEYVKEAQMHAGCLSISEGAPGWEDFLDKPFGPNCSLAMRKVAELRMAYEVLQDNYKQMEKGNSGGK